MKKLVLIGLIGISLIVLVGFSSDAVKRTSFISENSEIKVGWVEFSDLDSIKCSYSMFTGTEERIIKVEIGDCILLNYSITVDEGGIEIEVRDPAGEVLWKHQFEKGSFASSVKIETNQSGWHKVVIRGEGAGGSFDVSWKVERRCGYFES
ncbi:hypothetical protein DRP05_09130 [Archaeoglobales archaeon]|nr:MAG: hypothetical protein DRP05_09130 [Archaeoglobales archaeon]